MKEIGIIGGLGPQATMDFVKRLHDASQAVIPQRANSGYPPLTVKYVRNAPMVDPAAKVLTPHPDLLEAARYLGERADFLTIASNTPHIFQKEIEQASGKRVLSMIDVTIQEVKRSGVKKVGVMGAGLATMRTLYQDPLEAMGIESVGVPEGLMPNLSKAIFSFMEGRCPSRSVQAVVTAKDFLSDQGAQKIIFGCTELPLIINHEYSSVEWTGWLINPAVLLAKAAIREALK